MTETEQENAGEAGQKKRLTRRGAIIGGAVGGALALGVCYVALGGLWSRYLTLPAYAVMLFIFLASPIWVTVAAIRHRKEKHFAPWPVRILCGTILLAMFGGFGYLTGSQAFKAIENTPDRYLPLGEFKSPDGHQARADSVFFSHDGRHLFISAEVAGSQTKMVEVESGKVVREFPFSRVALGPNGKLLCSNPMTADFRLVEVETGNDIWKRKAGSTLDTLPPTFLAFGPEGKIIVAGHSMGLYLLDAATGEVQHTLSEKKKTESRFISISFHPNTSLVAVLQGRFSTEDGPIVVWDTMTGKKVITLGPEAGTFSGFEFHPHKRILFVRLANERMWKGALISQGMKRYSRIKLKGIEIHILPGTSEARFRLLDPIRFLEEEGGGRTGHHRRFRILERESGKVVSTFGGRKPRLEYPETGNDLPTISAWALSPDRKKLAGVGAGFIEIWDLE